MSPVTHLFMSWSVSNIGHFNRKDRLMITASGIIPDVDGFGIIADILTRHTQHPFHWWDRFHHVFGHNLGFGIGVALVAFCLGTQRRLVALLVLLNFHLHLLCDLVGARGPEGYQWPIPYLLPYSNSVQLVWEYQWALNAWPNFVITGLLIILSFYLAWKRGYSFIGLFSQRADAAFVKTLRSRFGVPQKITDMDGA